MPLVWGAAWAQVGWREPSRRALLIDWNLGGGRGGGPVCLPGTTQTAYQPGLEARVSTTPGPALLSFLAFVTLFVFSLGLPAAPELHTPGRSVFPVMGVWEG